MSFKNCPTPDYRKYEIGKSFDGSIIHVSSPTKGLVYAIDHETLEDFSQIEEFKPKTAYKKPPSFGDTFIWFDKVRKTSYRAYRLNTSSADTQSVKSFLFDIGEIKWENFSTSQYFKIPMSLLKIPPLGICCIVDSFPKPNEDFLKSEFLNETRIGRSFKFTVLRKGAFKNSLAEHEKCMVMVNIEDVDDEYDAEQEELPVVKRPPASEKHFHKLTYMDDGVELQVPFMIEQLTATTERPQPGSIIMVYLTEVGSHPSCVYARCNTQESFVEEKLTSEFISMSMWMNQSEVFKTYRGLGVVPIVNEMVLVEGKHSRIHRAVVKNVLGAFCQVFLIDVGCTLTVRQNKLFKFPKEFATLPVQAVRLHIANMESLSDELRFDAVETIQSCPESIRTALVIKSSEEELSVHLYDVNGVDVVDLMQIRIRDQLAKMNI